MLKIKRFLFISLFFCIVLLVMAGSYIFALRGENSRLTGNVHALQKGFDTLTNTTNAIFSNVKELERQYPAIVSKLDSMQIKVKNVKAVVETKTTHNHTFKTTVRDTFIFDTIPAKQAIYTDKFTNFVYLHPSYADTAMVTYNTYDSIIQVLHQSRVPGFPFKKGWFKKQELPGFPFGWAWFKKPPVKQKIDNINPNSKIGYSRVIIVNK